MCSTSISIPRATFSTVLRAAATLKLDVSSLFVILVAANSLRHANSHAFATASASASAAAAGADDDPLAHIDVDQEPNICKDYPLLHLCLIRPMLKGALAEISYLVNSVAFLNNGPDGYYLSDSHFAGEQDETSVPLEFAPADTRHAFIFQNDNNDDSQSAQKDDNSLDQKSADHRQHISSADYATSAVPAAYVADSAKYKRNLGRHSFPSALRPQQRLSRDVLSRRFAALQIMNQRQQQNHNDNDDAKRNAARDARASPPTTIRELVRGGEKRRSRG